MKKLLIITRSLSKDDGQGRYSVEMINQLKEKYDLIIFCAKNPFFSLKLFKVFRKIDFIHCFSDHPHCLMPFWPWFFNRKPVFITAHGTYGILPLDRFKTKFLLKRAYKKADKVMCVSDFTKKQILKRINLNNIIVINSGVDYDKFQINFKPKIKKEKIILSVGALKPRKGYHISIPAIAGAKKKHSDIKYYIVGGKPPKEYLELVKKYNLEKNIKFFENISDEELIKLYYEANLFLLTPIVINNNDFEGFGLVYLEAGACGLSVIGTLDCGAEDAIVNNQTGFLVPQNNIQKTTEVILKLLDNPELAKKLGENGRKRAQQMSWSNVVKKYIKIYES